MSAAGPAVKIGQPNGRLASGGARGRSEVSREPQSAAGLPRRASRQPASAPDLHLWTARLGVLRAVSPQKAAVTAARSSRMAGGRAGRRWPDRRDRHPGIRSCQLVRRRPRWPDDDPERCSDAPADRTRPARTALHCSLPPPLRGPLALELFSNDRLVRAPRRAPSGGRWAVTGGRWAVTGGGGRQHTAAHGSVAPHSDALPKL